MKYRENEREREREREREKERKRERERERERGFEVRVQVESRWSAPESRVTLSVPIHLCHHHIACCRAFGLL